MHIKYLKSGIQQALTAMRISPTEREADPKEFSIHNKCLAKPTKYSGKTMRPGFMSVTFSNVAKT